MPPVDGWCCCWQPQITPRNAQHNIWRSEQIPHWIWNGTSKLQDCLSYNNLRPQLHICITFSNCKINKKLGQVGVRTLLRITRPAYRELYLVIICPNAHAKFTKSEIRSGWSRFEHCSQPLVQPIASHVWSLVAPMHMKSIAKVKLCQVEVSSNIAHNHSSSPYEIISGHYLPQFIWKVDQKWN